MKDAAGNDVAVGDTVITMFDDNAMLVVYRAVVLIDPDVVGLVELRKTDVGIVSTSVATSANSAPVRYQYPDQIAKVTIAPASA